MEILGVVQYMFCLLAQCNSTDEQRSSSLLNTTTSAVVFHVTTATASSSNEIDDVREELISDRLVRDTSVIMQEAISFSLSGEARPLDERPLRHQDGAACRFNRHCTSGCCLVNATNRAQRSCSPLTRPRDPCEIGQIKGGAYGRHCPCLAGDGACQEVADGGHVNVCAE